MDEWKSYGGRLQWAMRQAGKTNQSELARAVGVKPQSIQYLCDPESGAQGSTHTPALARVLGVSAHWLARGEGYPLDPAERGGARAESHMLPYLVSPGMGVPVKGLLKGSPDNDQISQEMTGEDGYVWPQPAAGAHALRVKGNALAPYAKDGQYLVVRPPGDDLQPEDVLLVRLKTGEVLVRELMVLRDDSLVLLPVLGGQPQAMAREDIDQLLSVLCVVPRRGWRPLDH